MTYEQAQEALLALARGHGGLITAADVESLWTVLAAPGKTVPAFAAVEPTVSAAARAFAGSTNVFAVPRDDEGWFPFSEIRITVL